MISSASDQSSTLVVVGPSTAPKAAPESAPESGPEPRNGGATTSRGRRAVGDGLKSLSSGYMEVLLLKDGWIGIAFACGTFFCPRIGLCGLLALSAGRIGTRILGITGANAAVSAYGMHGSNPLLVGLGLGSLLELSWQSAAFIALMGIAAVVLTTFLAGTVGNLFKLPVMTLPFVLTISAAYLAIHHYPAMRLVPAEPLFALDQFDDTASFVISFLRSLGAILFVPHEWVGLLFGMLVISQSRILFGTALLGFTAGVTVRAFWMGGWEPAMQHPGNFNFVLIGMFLGGVFFVPGIRSYVSAAIAVVVGAMLLDACESGWTSHGMPVFALPFNLTALGFLYVLSAAGHARRPAITGRTPEETLEIDLAVRRRFCSDWRSIGLPFFGRWYVWQAFDGPWTHQGVWRHAYDYVITDEHGKTHADHGDFLTDYYCYRRPVLSPVSGTVVKVVNHLPDNEPGRINNTDKWGNLVLIWDDRGFYVQLSHFACGSVRVTAGSIVTEGIVLGLCGNSGFSPQPHIHIQVQLSPEIAAPTVPFSFHNYLQADTLVDRGHPVADRTIENPLPTRRLENAWGFILDDTVQYDLLRQGRVESRMSLRVGLEFDGTMFLESDRGARLYFARYPNAVYLYRIAGDDPRLGLFLQAMPRVLFDAPDRTDWADRIPAVWCLRYLRRVAAQLIGSLVPEQIMLPVRMRFESSDRLRTEIDGRRFSRPIALTTCFDDQKGPRSIVGSDWELRRVVPDGSDPSLSRL